MSNIVRAMVFLVEPLTICSVKVAASALAPARLAYITLLTQQGTYVQSS